MKKIIDKKKLVIAVLTILLMSAVFRFIRSKNNISKEFKESRLYFDTYVTIQCFYDPKKDIHTIVNQCWNRLSDIQVSMNSKSAFGYVAQINESGFNGIQVKDDLYNLLKDALTFSKQTNGAFDITVAPLIKLWKEAQEIKKEPDEGTINLLKNNIGYQYIELKKNNYVYLKKKEIKIDLGAIAKGYAVDEVARILKQNKIENFLIDAGGDMLCNGKNKNKKPWRVGVQDPKDKHKIIDTLKLSNMAVTTSGNYERFYTIGNKRYSHIINPTTGYPQENVLSATVIAPSAEEADAYSTALCVLGAREGIALINRTKNIDAMVIETKKDTTKTYKSDGYNLYK